jgi:hypothetical protein
VVAEAGSGWVLAPALVGLMHQLDAAYPDRPRAADGSIGDARHQAEAFSDHNPRLFNGTWYVTAVDITAAPFCDALAALLVLDPRTKYVIWQRRYYQCVPWSRSDPVGQWVPYNGTDPHTSHIHLSLQLSASPDKSRWLLPIEEEDPMAGITLADIRREVGEEIQERLDAFRTQHLTGTLERVKVMAPQVQATGEGVAELLARPVPPAPPAQS